MLKRSLLLSLALLLLGTVGCNDSKPPAMTVTPDGGSQPGVDLGPEEQRPPNEFRILLVDPEYLEAEVATQETISAHVFSSQGNPVPGVSVTFEILGDNPGGAFLDSRQISTNERGRSLMRLNVGSTPGEFKVKVSIPEADPIEVRVVALPHPTGLLEVSLEGVGPGPSVRIGPIDIFVMPGTNRCPFSPVTTPFGELAKARVAGVENKTDFGGQAFRAGDTVTLWARGMVGNNQMRTMAASGCQDGVIIPERDTARITLTMVVRPLNTVGTYDVVGHYDFTGAIPGTAGDVIRRLNVLFGEQNIAEFLIDGIQTVVKIFFDNLIVDVIFWIIDQIQDPLEQAVNRWIFDNAPDWLLDFMQVGEDLFQIVNALELLEVIRFDKTGSDFMVSGSEEWVGIALYWRLQCEEDDPPDCGRFEFNMEELLNARDPIEAVYATFGARSSEFNKLRMDPHDVNLQYGRLILFVLNNMVLPNIADGARSITEAIINVIDCEGIAWGITGDDGEWGGSFLGWDVGFDVNDAIGWCEEVAGWLGGEAENLLEGLSFDSVLTIEGGCDLYEDDLDLLVDRLENGTYRGWIIVDGERGEQEIRGSWRGDRRSVTR